ncbi:MAG: HIRAN domain-containing protein [Actinomycetota bacterium]|nr:HIRAN domain-containing protein [Actinomycetota bacterium]
MGSIAPLDPKLLALLRRLDRRQVPKPFGQEIYIISTYIAGTAYYRAKEVKDNLKQGSHLVLKRETDNSYDDRAIAVLDLDQNKLGYLPQRKMK